VAITLGLGLFFALFLPLFPLILFLLSVPLIFAYSALRVKKMFLFKNAYTGFTMGLVSLIGASASGAISADAFYIFFTAFFIGSIGNLIGDIRGHKGDLATGIKTLPVRIGVDASKKLVHFMILGFPIYVLVSGYRLFYPFVPFMFLISLFLAMDRHKPARYSIVFSFIAFSLFLFLNTADRGMM
jgi:4-hydroxybenzoate polyprenyltransferase